MKFFSRFKINEHWQFYTKRYRIAVSAPLNNFGPRLRDITAETLVKMDLEQSGEKGVRTTFGRGLCILFFCVDYKASLGVSHEMTSFANLL